MAQEPEPAPEELHSLQEELATLVRRSLAQRAHNEEIGERMRQVTTQITKLSELRTPPPVLPSVTPEPV